MHFEWNTAFNYPVVRRIGHIVDIHLPLAGGIRGRRWRFAEAFALNDSFSIIIFIILKWLMIHQLLLSLAWIAQSRVAFLFPSYSRHCSYPFNLNPRSTTGRPIQWMNGTRGRSLMWKRREVAHLCKSLRITEWVDESDMKQKGKHLGILWLIKCIPYFKRECQEGKLHLGQNISLFMLQRDEHIIIFFFLVIINQHNSGHWNVDSLPVLILWVGEQLTYPVHS